MLEHLADIPLHKLIIGFIAALLVGYIIIRNNKDLAAPNYSSGEGEE